MKLGNEKGWTLFELILVIGVVMIVMAAIVPVAYHWYKEAKLIRAKKDVATIAVGILAFQKDLSDWPIWVEGNNRKDGDAVYTVLYSAVGEHPSCDGTYASTTEWQVALGSGGADTIENQLVHGRPGGVVANEYPDGADDVMAPDASYFYWQGPYIGAGGMGTPGSAAATTYKLPPDPWGNKYYVNVAYLHPPHLAHGSPNKEAVFIISAGANEMLETEFDVDSRDWKPRGDDICFRIR
jgi:type II secretory pathway pseudopilin PulG